MWLSAWLIGCGGGRALEVCDCGSVEGHAVVIEGACSCLPHLEATPNPEGARIVELSSGEEPDWDALNASLGEVDVVVRFDPAGEWDRLQVNRTDTGPHRLVLDGGGGDARAIVAGILTPFDSGAHHRVTVRGFEITGSRDKGIYWEAGDDVLIEDVIVHDNRGSPSLNLQYSNRSGFRTQGFTVRNSHIYDQTGECLYIGGSEGEDAPSHTGVRIENNLIHDCRDPLDSKHDAINIKDRLSDVVVERNVVLHADWGIEVASPGLYRRNLAIDINREGFQVSDIFSPISDMVFEDNVVLRPGHDGFHIITDQAEATGMVMTRNTVIGAGEAGLLVAANAGLQLEVTDFVVLDSDAGFDGWGEPSVTVEGCGVGGNGIDADRILEDVSGCEAVSTPDISQPAGPDGLFFTDDDPWLVPGGAALP